MPETAGDSSDTSRILHELGGVLSSVLGFAQLIERRPDHPRTREFMSILRSEAERAVDALRDLQLLRALQLGAPIENVERVPVVDVLSGAASRAGAASVDAAAAAAELAAVAVACDRELIGNCAGRCMDFGARRGFGDVKVARSAGDITVSIEVGDAREVHELQEQVEELFPAMRPVAVARALLRRWGGDAAVVAVDDKAFIELRLKAV